MPTRKPESSCRMEIEFSTTREGRPEIYDFFWDHVPHLLGEMGQKNVQTRVHLSLDPGTQPRSRERNQMLQFFIQKLARDSRFQRANTSPVETLHLQHDVTVPLSQLENLVSAYNILFEAALASVRISTPEIELDFSPVSQEKVVIHTTLEHAPQIKEFLATRLSSPPRVRMITFTDPHPFQESLAQGGH